ncbi:MAG TPA: pitrilysin family protein [Candidatus Nanoarchaeia archaeon]|nr:pitrilysin family protein [Candidatus Nanoarchaeia archaeon]
MKLLRKKLKNGMTVLMEKRELPVVSFCIANKIGGSYEDSKTKGIAHFIEHLLFTGTKTRNHEDISREIEKKGGVMNAFTSHEVTSFHFKLPSEHLFSGMDILIDMLNNSIMDEEKFEKEKKVILEEIKMYHDSPRMHASNLLEQNLYAKPFGELVIGTKESVSNLKRDFVYKYYKERYCPSNYVAVVVGDADFEKVCDKLEKAFEKKEFNFNPVEIKKQNKSVVEKRKGIDQAHFVFGMHAPLDEKEFEAMQLLNMYLANGMSSRLFLKIREEKGLAYSVRGDVSREKNYGYYYIYVGTKKEAVEEVKKIILDEFKKVDKMTEKDLEEAKTRIIGLRRLSSEESGDVMNELLFTEAMTGRAEDYYDFEERIRKIKLSDVKKVAKIKEYSTVAVVPE